MPIKPPMRWTGALVLALCLLAAPSRADQTSPIAFSAEDRLDQVAITARDRTRPFFFRLDRGDGGQALTFTADKGSDFKAWLEPAGDEGRRDPGARALALRLSSDRDENAKDKIVLDAVPHWSSQAFNVDDDGGGRYFAFSIKFDRLYEVSKSWVIHLQVWQCCGGHPPFAMTVVPSANKDAAIALRFAFRDDEREREQGGVDGELHTMTVERGTWNRFVFHFVPVSDRATGPGTIGMWHDGVVAFCAKPHWAYAPRAATPGQPAETTKLGIDLGIYRRRSQTTQTVYLDDIAYGIDPSAVGLTAGEASRC